MHINTKRDLGNAIGVLPEGGLTDVASSNTYDVIFHFDIEESLLMGWL